MNWINLAIILMITGPMIVVVIAVAVGFYRMDKAWAEHDRRMKGHDRG